MKKKDDATRYVCGGCKLSTLSMFDLSGKPHIDCLSNGSWQHSISINFPFDKIHSVDWSRMFTLDEIFAVMQEIENDEARGWNAWHELRVRLSAEQGVQRMGLCAHDWAYPPAVCPVCQLPVPASPRP